MYCRNQLLWGGGWEVWAQGGGLQSQRLTKLTVIMSQVGTRLWGTEGPAGADGGVFTRVQAKCGTFMT